MITICTLWLMLHYNKKCSGVMGLVLADVCIAWFFCSMIIKVLA